jgi:2'-5' RNA ligase
VSVRAFVAVPLAGPALERLEEVQRALRRATERAAWSVRMIPRDNLHLTLRFLGDVAEARIEEIAAALAPIAARPPFDLRLAGLGAFPPRGPARVLWIAVEDGKDDLAALARDVEARIETVGFSPEERPFKPHLTLARVKRAGGRHSTVLDGVEPKEAGTSRVSEVILYRSELRPDRAHYHPLRCIKLAGSAERS